MLEILKKFIKEEEGMGTVEIVIIVAVLVAIALIFGTRMKEWVGELLIRVTGEGDTAVNEISNDGSSSMPFNPGIGS